MTSNWTDSSFEGMKLRSIFKNLYKEFTKTEDIDELVRLAHAIVINTMWDNPKYPREKEIFIKKFERLRKFRPK